jgi:hypothetical protein
VAYLVNYLPQNLGLNNFSDFGFSVDYNKKVKSLYGAFQQHDLSGLLYSYPNKFPHSSPEAPRIIQMRKASTSEGGNYYQFC